MRRIKKHYDKRFIEFALQVTTPSGKTEFHHPTNCGYTSQFRFQVGDERDEDVNHPSFDFELWCWQTFGDRHREIKPLPYTQTHLLQLRAICKV